MKGKDLKAFFILIILAIVIEQFVSNKTFIYYSDLIVFLSIMIGFKISSLAILFNSPLRKILWDIKDDIYKTDLHRIKDYYKHSIIFGMISIILIFVIPDTISFTPFNGVVYFCKQSIVYPILAGSSYCLYKICKDMFKIFTYPTNQ